MTDLTALAEGLTEKPFAYCCAEAGGYVEACDCVNKRHGTMIFKATCIIPNCRNRAPDHEPFCSTHRGSSSKAHLLKGNGDATA